MKTGIKYWQVVLLVFATVSSLHSQLFAQSTFKFPSFKNERIQSLDAIWVQVGGKLALCSHSERGSINLTVGGGKPPYSFKWNTNESVQNRTNLNAGTYTVWITDSEGRVHQERIVIQPPFPLVLNPVTKRDATCGSGNDGYAKISVKIGRNDYDPAKPPYQISWSNGLKDVWEANNLAPGTYVVKVADKFNCETSISFEIKSGSAGITVSESVQHVTCSSLTNGRINLSVQGGEGPYTYLWSNGATSKDLIGVAAGIYQVQVRDAKGCSFQGSYTIVSPSGIQLSETLVMPSCGPISNGQIKLNISGGTAPYTFQWSNGSSQPHLQNLAAGIYSVKVTDASGCIIEKEYTLSNLSTLTLASFQKQDVACFGDNSGKIDLNITGATGAFQAFWSDGSNSINRTNLAPGTYAVVLRDQHCEINASFQILGPSEALSAIGTVQNPSCFGNDGKITLNPKGGTAPYSYKWSNGALTKDLDGLGQGKYTVDIVDKNGCTFQATFDLVSPLAITIEETLKDPSCAGASNGSILLKVAGGNTPYTYLWSNGSTQSGIQNLAAGTYKVKITDATGCSVEKEYGVKNQSQLAVTVLEVDPVSCGGGSDGRILLGVTGGKGVVKIVWEDGFSGFERTNLKSGTYRVMISDESNCGISNEVKVEETNPLVARIDNAIEMDCDLGQLKGRAWVDITGGKPPYVIKWENENQTTNEIQFNKSGILKVTIKDALGCQTESEVKVTFPDYNYQGGGRLNFEFRKLVFSSEPEVTIEEQIIFESEISPEFISWEWDFGDGNKSQERNPVHRYKTAGTFEVQLAGMDIYGCTLKELNKVVVTQPEEMMVIPNAFSPNGDNLNDSFIPKMKGIREFTLQVFNIWGEKLYEGSGLETTGWDGTYKGQMVPAGNYIYRIDYVNWEGIKKSSSGNVTLIR